MIGTEKYQYWLLSNEYVVHTRKRKLQEFFSDAYHVYYASESELRESGCFNKDELELFIRHRSKEDIDLKYESFLRSPYSFMTIESENYPNKLRNIYDPPYGLFYLGKPIADTKSVSIVGARRCSEYGKKMANELGQAFAERGFTVISGMARGIDSYAHKGCIMQGGTTLAVLGSGVDVVYPKENRLLYEEIAKTGTIVSEFPVGAQPVRVNFPLRNRIVSGLSDVVIVVEAKEKSGSLITADLALDQGKDIYAVPGRVGDSLSAGCNKLITQGAGIVLSVDQLMKEISGESDDYVRIKRNAIPDIKLTKEQVSVLGMFDLYPKSLAEIQIKSNIDYLELISIVMSLVQHGLLMEVFKNHFVICG